MAAVILLQFSSNFAQGPYQGYIPDLVPGRQVGVASGMLGAANIAGNLLGPGLAILFVAVLPTVLGYPEITLGLFVVIGAIELITMLITVFFVPDRPAPPTTLTLTRAGALGAWGTDLLAQRDYIWLLVSRLFVLTALVSLQAFAVFFLENAHGMEPDEAQTAQFPLIMTVAVAALLSAVPGGWISSRIGRKPVLYVAIGLGVAGAAVIAVAPDVLDGGGGRRADRHLQRRLPGRRLGADDRHHPQGRIGSLHGHQQHRRRRRRADRQPPSAGLRSSWSASPRSGPDLAYRAIFVLMAIELLIGALGAAPGDRADARRLRTPRAGGRRRHDRPERDAPARGRARYPRSLVIDRRYRTLWRTVRVFRAAALQRASDGHRTPA